MNLDDEAERLLQLHPAVRAGVQPEYRETHWLPRHAVPRRPAPYRPTDETIELQVAADIARLDRELDPQAQAFDPVQLAASQTVGGVRSVRHGKWSDPATWTVDMTAPAGKVVIAYTITLALENMIEQGYRYAPAPASAPPRQRKPKTYVAPGRKQGKTWIARLEQSKRAKARTN